jgi:hypothetical protein
VKTYTPSFWRKPESSVFQFDKSTGSRLSIVQAEAGTV